MTVADDQRPQLCFLHIPKTAGTSLTELLIGRIGGDRVCPAGTLVDYDAMSDEELARYDLLKGHFDYALRARLRRPAQFLTMLRDPVDRVVSLYHQWRRSPVPPGGLGGEAVAKRYDLADFIDCGETAVEWRCVNAQVYQIADRVRQARDPEKDREMLDLAKAHLREFAFVGVSERFAESVTTLCGRFGWPVPATMPSANVADEAGGIEPAIRRRIEERNVADRELYDFAVELLHERP